MGAAVLGSLLGVVRDELVDNLRAPAHIRPQTEDTPFDPVGRKATVRAQVTTMLLDEMHAGRLETVIDRGVPEMR